MLTLVQVAAELAGNLWMFGVLGAAVWGLTPARGDL